MIENEKCFETRTLKASTDLFNYREIRKVKRGKKCSQRAMSTVKQRLNWAVKSILCNLPRFFHTMQPLFDLSELVPKMADNKFIKIDTSRER